MLTADNIIDIKHGELKLKKKENKLHDDHFKKMIYLDKKKITLGSYSSYACLFVVLIFLYKYLHHI